MSGHGSSPFFCPYCGDEGRAVGAREDRPVRGAGMSHASSPFFCPYCGDESLRPYGETHGEWRCESCRRAFALRTVKQAPVPERTEVAP